MTEINAKNEFMLDVDSLAYGPHGIGRVQGRAIFLPFTAPGDKIEARVVADKGKYAIGEMVRLVEPSPLRQTPPCPYFGECGGCPWQHVRYDTQLAAKEKNVADALRRIGKLEDFELRPILRSPQDHHYRRRLRFQIDDRRRLGFYRASSHDLIEIDSCLIGDEEASRHLGRLRQWVRDLKSALDQLEIVVGDEPGQIAIVGSAEGDFVAADESVCAQLLERNSEISGLILSGRGWRRVWGKPAVSVKTEDGIVLSADGDVFTQVNREANRRVLRELLQAGTFDEMDRVLELYCGVGNFTLSIAKRAREVVAVEGYRPSVDNGKLNAQKHGIFNVKWITSHVPAAIKRLQRRQRFSKIVLNPPRSGAKGVGGDLAALGAEKIFYLSCDPTTLARDLAALTKQGYRLTWVQPLDLFPHTFHVETLTELVRSKTLAGQRAAD